MDDELKNVYKALKAASDALSEARDAIDPELWDVEDLATLRCAAHVIYERLQDFERRAIALQGSPVTE